MANHYQDIGYDVRSGEDIIRYIKNNPDKCNEYDIEGKYSLLVLNPEGDSQIRLYIDNLTDSICYVGPDFTGDSFSMVRVCNWVEYDKEIHRGLLRIENIYDDMDIPINVELLDHKEAVVGEKSSLHFAYITAYTESIELYDSDSMGGSFMAPEAIIPCGTFTIEDDPDFEESPEIICNGVVTGSKKCINPITNNEFYRINVHSLGLGMTVVAAPEYFDRYPEIGDYIHGVFYLAAEIESEVYLPDTERSDCADIMGVKLPASDSVMGWISNEIDLLRDSKHIMA